MRPDASEFSPHPDRALGAALRASLDRPGDAAFAAAVVARAQAAGVGSSRVVLGRRTRLAVAAAVVGALLGGLLAGTRQPASMSFDAAWVSASTGSADAAVLLTAENAPDASLLFAAVVDN